MTWGKKPHIPEIVRGCMGKERMQEWQANGKAKRLAKKTGNEVRAYLCPMCSGWHITSKRAGYREDVK